MPQTITSVEGFVRKLRHIRPADDEVLFYRGHSKRDYELLPSVLRNNALASSEHGIIRELIVAHPAEFSDDRTMVERLARMQHYELPTRLLDITANPLVALYFAAKEHDDSPGEVLMLRVKRRDIKFSDSDTVSCIANLALLEWQEKTTLNFNLRPKRFNAQRAIGRLVHFIRDEKPYFHAGIIQPPDLRRIICVKTKFNSKRILAQAGAFLLFGLLSNSSAESPLDTLEKVKINGRKKRGIIGELEHFGINDSVMFPEIESAAKYIAKKFGTESITR